jgi:hypothetical protein
MRVLHVLQFPQGELLTPAPQRQLLAQHDTTTAGILAAGEYLQMFEVTREGGRGVVPQFTGTLARVQRWRQQQPLHWLQVGKLKIKGGWVSAV